MENGRDSVCTVAHRPVRRLVERSTRGRDNGLDLGGKAKCFLMRCGSFDIIDSTLLVLVIALLFNHIDRVFLG